MYEPVIHHIAHRKYKLYALSCFRNLLGSVWLSCESNFFLNFEELPGSV
jgi:hypothetical protein